MITRFAPSPTGPLHLGHAYSALLASDMARNAGGKFLLRLEDIDQSRARPQWEVQIFDDLKWLGLSWPDPVMRQSTRIPTYQRAITSLWQQGLLYSCCCARRDIQQAISAPQEGGDVVFGPDGPIYPGTCRPATATPNTDPFPDNLALRLNMSKAVENLPQLSFVETGAGPGGQTGSIEFSPQHALSSIGDIVLSRRDMGTSYHLSVVIDDAAQNITHVIRGADLFEATKIHVILQNLLNLPTPTYHHHSLIRDEDGKRLAKRDDARALQKYRKDGATPLDIRKLIGLD